MSSATLRFLQQENARLQDEIDALREENTALKGYMDALNSLYWATQEINSENDLFELLDKILYSAMQVAQAEDGSLMLYDDETNELEFVLVHGDLQGQLQGYRVPANEGIAGWIASHQQPLIVNNPAQDLRFSSNVDTEFDFDTNALVGVPMLAHDKLIGVIELLNKQSGQEFVDTDATLLLILAQVAATALEEMRLKLEAEDAAATTTPEVAVN